MSAANRKFALALASTLAASAIIGEWRWKFSVTDRLARIETKLDLAGKARASVTETNSILATK